MYACKLAGSGDLQHACGSDAAPRAPAARALAELFPLGFLSWQRQVALPFEI